MFSFFTGPGIIFDTIFLTICAFYVYEEISYGSFISFLHLATFVCAFFSAIILYPYIMLLVSFLPYYISLGSAVVIIGTAAFIIFSFIFSCIKFDHIVLPDRVDSIAAIFLSLLSFCFMYTFFTMVILSIPASKVIKNSISSSIISRELLLRAASFDMRVRTILNQPSEILLNSISIPPLSQKQMALGFTIDDPSPQMTEKDSMVAEINTTRKKMGRSELVWDENLSQAGKVHATDMVMRGYFSHYNEGGQSVYDRLEKLNINYEKAQEMMSLSPNYYLSLQHILNYPQNVQVLSSAEYKKIGVSIIDAKDFGNLYIILVSD